VLNGLDDQNQIAEAQNEHVAAVGQLAGAAPDGTVRDALRRSCQKLAKKLFEAPGINRAAEIRNYFNVHYNIGKEVLTRDIPSLVLVRRAVWALLVMLHVLQNSTPDWAKNSGLWKLISLWILRPLSLVTGAMYGFLTVMAQGRAAAAAIHAVAWSVTVQGDDSFARGCDSIPM